MTERLQCLWWSDAVCRPLEIFRTQIIRSNPQIPPGMEEEFKRWVKGKIADEPKTDEERMIKKMFEATLKHLPDVFIAMQTAHPYQWGGEQHFLVTEACKRCPIYKKHMVKEGLPIEPLSIITPPHLFTPASQAGEHLEDRPAPDRSESR